MSPTPNRPAAKSVPASVDADMRARRTKLRREMARIKRRDYFEETIGLVMLNLVGLGIMIVAGSNEGVILMIAVLVFYLAVQITNYVLNVREPADEQ